MRTLFFLSFIAYFTVLQAQPILIVSPPKSGTTYVWHALATYFSVPKDKRAEPYRNRFQNPKDYFIISSQQYNLIASKYRAIDVPFCSHYEIYENTLRSIVSWKNKVVFVPRDPREAIVSAIIHKVNYLISKDWHDLSNADAIIKQHKNLVLRELAPYYAPQLQIRAYRLKRWMNFQKKYPNNVFIVPFDLLKEDHEVFFLQIMKPFGYDKKNFDLTKIPPPQIGTHRVRKSPKDEWKEYLTDDQKKLFYELIPSEVRDYYGWD